MVCEEIIIVGNSFSADAITHLNDIIKAGGKGHALVLGHAAYSTLSSALSTSASFYLKLKRYVANPNAAKVRNRDRSE